MSEYNFNKTRRDFLKLSSLAVFSFDPTVSALSRWLNVNKAIIENCFDYDFHYFGNNLINLHFYFINAKIKGKRLIQLSNKSKAFMVVKIPQQHISEQLLRKTGEGGFDEDYHNSDKRTTSKISGFSFLAFELFINISNDVSEKKTNKSSFNKKNYVILPKIENLLDWNNSFLFKLRIPEKGDYKKIESKNFKEFKEKNETSINDIESFPSTGYICSLYKTICDKVFTKGSFPLTVLEIPEGLLVAPYLYSETGQTQNPFADAKNIKKANFVYNSSKGKVLRTVEEIWSAQLFFNTVEGRQSPSLRAIGYIPRDETKRDRDKNECPTEDIKYLPTLLDKNEIVYLTSLGRELNEGKEWNIDTRGLTLTGLGTIAKFHYKNLTPPCITDLVEYEHHFTLGRDEYIKVARIGVISVTGQRALHVKIGQRKIKNGTSYMEFKEYIEIIQKEISYFDKSLFIDKDPNNKEPFNYIQARKNKTRSKIIHSFDDIYDDSSNDNIISNDVWFDRQIWQTTYYENGKRYLPQNWNTHYKRWCFTKIISTKFITGPLKTDANDKKNTITACGNCSENYPLAFWPILELNNNDARLTFKGIDWNGNSIHFESTFLFIRKTLIEGDRTVNDKCLNALYENFVNGDKNRRIIQINSEIAFTADYSPKSEDHETLPNKSNVAKTEFIEYYFSLCRESNGNLLKISNGKIIENDNEPIGCIFNDRIFPLFPQVKEAKVFLENIQSFTTDPIPSIIEYNDEFINFGFERTITVTNEKKENLEVVYNKARLIFNHTDDFIKGIVLDKDSNKWVNDNGYKRIKKVFTEAGSTIGGLVNPDFDIQSIGLVKQSIALGKDINKKYAQVTEFTDKIEKFNPSDLLQQAPEIFNGISLIDILQEVFPEYEAPMNDIKNVASKIDTIKNELLDNPIYLEIKADLRYVDEKVTKFLKNIEGFQKNIDEAIENIKVLKDKFNSEFLVSEIEKLVNSVVSKYRIKIIEEYNGLANIANFKIEDAVEYFTTELISKAEVIYPYYEKLNDAKKILDEIEKSVNFKPIVTKYKKVFFEKTATKDSGANKIKTFSILIDFEESHKDLILRDYDLIKKSIKENIREYFDLYQIYSKCIINEIDSFNKYSANQSAALYNVYLVNKKATIDALRKYEYEVELGKGLKLFANELLTELKANAKTEIDIKTISEYEPELKTIQEDIIRLVEIIETNNLPHCIDLYNKAIQDVIIFETKLEKAQLLLIKSEIYGKDFIKKILDNRTALETFYVTNYDALKVDFNTLVFGSKDAVTQYVTAIGKKRFEDVLNLFSDKIGLGKIREEINIAESKLTGYIEQQIVNVRTYEEFIKKQINNKKREIIDILSEKIEEKKLELLNDPENQVLLKAFVKGKELLNLLSTLSKKEINYAWQISSFKNADFGIVSFLASNSPKTSLSVNVKNTIYFQPNKFPSVVQKIDSIAENRLNNFGISLLKAIIINFNEVSFVAGTNRKSKFEVKIRDVQFAGAFSFVQALESIFKKLLGDNFSVRISPQNVEIEYLLPIAYLGTPSFGFKDILFKIVYTLYFNKKPMELGVGIGTPENKTKLSVGIYTGFFYFIVIGNPKQGITTIEVSIEFGGYFGLSLGPLRGEVKLVVGLYYRKDSAGVIIEGYFLVEGRVMLWFIMVTVRFYMGVRSQGGYIEGRCTVSYEIRLGRFFKRSFTANYYKKIAGASPENNVSGSTQKSINSVKSLKGNTKTIQARDVQNPIERSVVPLTKINWTTFINSYID